MMHAQKEVVADSRVDDVVGNNDEIEKNDDVVIIDDDLFIENDENVNANNDDVEWDVAETLLGLGNVTTETTNNKLFDEKLKDLLKTQFPKKNKYMNANTWDEEDVPKKSKKILHACTRPLLLLLRCLSNNNLNTAADVMKFFLKNYKMSFSMSIFRELKLIYLAKT